MKIFNYRFLFIILMVMIKADVFAIEVNDDNTSVQSSSGENPLKGLWEKNWLYRMNDGKYLSYIPHYKFYGDNDMISFSIKFDGADLYNMVFNGRYVSYKYISKDTIEEAASPLEIKIYDENKFNLFWKEKFLTFEEEWERSELIPSVVASWANAYHGVAEDKLAGCWKLVSISDGKQNKTYEMKQISNYRVYGDSQFLFLIINANPANSSASSAMTTFTGMLGTYKITNDSILNEKGIKYTVRFVSDDRIEKIKTDKDNNVYKEVWERTSMPSDYKKIIEPLDNYIMDVYTRRSNETALSDVVLIPDKLPEFPGGISGAMDYVAKNINYPKSCIKEQIEGNVMISFVVDKSGKVSSSTVLKSPDKRLSDEALRVINNMPLWTPGVKDGKNVNVKMTLPVKFNLAKERK